MKETLTQHGECAQCGYPVITITTNQLDLEALDPGSHWDWWMYCTNKTCEHHVGCGYFQTDPSWLIRHPR